MFGRWALNILIGVDQLCNTVLGGDPDETMSSRLGKLKVKHGGRIPWKRPLSKIIDWGLDRIDSNHTLDSIELDEGDDAVFKKKNNHTK